MMGILLAVFIAVSAVFLLLQPIKLRFSLSADPFGFSAEAALILLFGLFKPALSIEKTRGAPAVLKWGKGKEKTLTPPARKPPAASVFRMMRSAVCFNRLSVGGSMGIAGEPFASAILAGGFQTAFSALLPVMNAKRLDISIAPVFEKDIFSLSACGIIEIKTGRIILETIKMQKEIKNESSY